MYNIMWFGWNNEVFLSFFLEDQTSAPDVFRSCSFILCTHFEISLVSLLCLRDIIVGGRAVFE